MLCEGFWDSGRVGCRVWVYMCVNINTYTVNSSVRTELKVKVMNQRLESL